MIKRHLFILLLLNLVMLSAFSQPITKTFQPDAATGKDAYIAGSLIAGDYTGYDNSNFGNAGVFQSIRWTTGQWWTGRSLLQFDFVNDPNNNIPTNAIVTSATLYLYSAGHDRHTNNNSNASLLRRVSSLWSENEITWNMGYADDFPQNSITLDASTSNTQDYTLNVTDHVQSMVQNPGNNRGWVLRLQDAYETISARTKLSFHSSDAADASKRPKLVVSFYVPLSLNGANASTSCPGYTVGHTASPTGGQTGNYTYSWAPATALNCTTCASVVSTCTVSTNYTCTVTDGSETVSAQFWVGRSNIINVNVSANQTICSGSTTAALGSAATGGNGGPYTYSWLPVTGLSNSAIANPTANPTATTTYTLTVTNGSCTQSKTVTITVNAIPSITGTTPASRCGTGTVTLGATASAGTINWYAASTGGTSLGTGTSFTTPSISATTTYYVDATANSCVTASRTAVVATINAIPSITGTTPASTCGTGTVTLGATASAGTINWYAASTGGTSLGTGTSFTTPSISSTTTYYVDATANSCVTASRTAVVATINSIATISGTTPGSRCGTGTVILGATASTGTINWYAASTGGTSLGTGTSFTTPSISATTTYYVDATASGCTTASRTAVVATVNSVPTVNVSPGSASICIGNSAGLTASGATTYAWGPATGLNTTTGANVTASPTSTITYAVTGTTSGCSGTKTVTVTVNPYPTVTVSPTSAAICTGGNVALTAGGATTYAWSPSTGLNTTTGTSVTATPTATITYTVTGTTNGCTSSAGSTITVNPIPSVTLNVTSATICSGNSVNLNASGATTYAWGPATGLNTTTGANVTASPTSTITYTVTGTTSGCSGTKTVTITVNPIPAVSISPSAVTISNGNSTTLTASGASTYVWSPSTALNATTGASVIASPTITITYTVTGTANGCSGTQSVTVTCQDAIHLVLDGGYMHLGGGTNSAPVFLIVDDYNINNIIRLPSGGHIFTNGQYNFIKWNTSTATGSYVIPFGVDAIAADYIPFTFNKTGTENANLTVSTWYTNPQNLPHPGVSAVAAVHKMTGQGDSVTTAIDRFWDVRTSSSTIANLTFSYRAIENTTDVPVDEIKIQRWSPSGCLLWSSLLGSGNAGANTGVGTVGPVTNVTSFSPFVAVRSAYPLLKSNSGGLTVNAGADNMVCSGVATTLGGSPTVAGGTSPYTYSWLPAQFLNNSTAANPVSTPTATTNYTLTVSDQQGCSVMADVNLQVAALTVNPASSATICAGDNIELTASGMSSYNWSPASSLSSGSVANPIAFPSSTTTYSVSAAHNSCSGNSQITVTVLTTPTLSVIADQEICQGQSVHLTATGTGNFQWSPATGLSNPSIADPYASPTSTTEYTVKLTSANACSTEKKVTVIIDNIPVIQLGGNTTICQGASLQLDAIAGAQQFQWTPATGLDDPYSPSPLATPTASTTYTVTAVNGVCSSVGSMSVVVKKAPSAIFTFSYPGLQVQFSTNNPDPATYVWDFGDGTSGSSASPSHTYATEGTYRVCLNAQNECGASRYYCTDVIVKPVTVPCCQ